jgi:hypothetical protein
VLWLILVACLVIPRQNRHWRAWLILVPLVIALAIWGIFKQLVSLNASTSVSIFDHLVTNVLLSMTILWLVSGSLASVSGTIRVILSLFMVLLLGVIGVWAFGGMNFDDDSLSIFMIYAVWAFALVGGITVTRAFCRKCMGGVRFSLWLLLWMVVAFDAVLLPAFLLMAVIMGQSIGAGELLTIMFVQGTFAGAIVYLFALPYLVFTFRSDFYRERAMRCLGLSDAPPAAVEPVAGEQAVGAPDGSST